MRNIHYKNISSDVRNDKIKKIIEIVKLDKNEKPLISLNRNINSDIYFAESQRIINAEKESESSIILDLEKDKVLIKKNSLDKLLIENNSLKKLEGNNLTLLYSKDIVGGLLLDEYISETKFIFFRSTCHFYSGHYIADNIAPFYKYYDSFNSFYGLSYSKFEIRKADYLEMGKENDVKDMSLWIAGHKERLIVSSDSKEIMDFFKVNLPEELIYKKVIGLYREKDMHMLGIIPINS